MKPQTQHITASLVNLKYLYQFAAVPKAAREDYLCKLLKRSGAVDQKNVKLLKLIYLHIENGKFTLWDDDKMCRVLSITKDMLYCHKSRLLKGLRCFHFGVSNMPVSLKASTDEIELENATALNLKGMCREAKKIFLKIEQNLNKKKRKSFKDKYRLLIATRHLYLYYLHTESNKKRQQYLKHALRLCRKILSNKQHCSKNKNIFHEVTILQNYLMAFKSFQNKKKIKGQQNAVKYFKLALKPAEKNKNFLMLCQTLGNVAYHDLHLKNFEESKECLTKAFNVAAANNLKIEELILESIDINCNNRTNGQNEKTLRRRFINLMKKLPDHNIIPGKMGTIYTNLLPVASIYPEKDVFYNFLYNMNSNNIILYGYKYSFKMLYVSKLLYYGDKLFRLKNSKNNGLVFPIVKAIDQKYFEKLEESLIEININPLISTDLYFQKEVFLYSLLLEIGRGLDCNLDNTDYIIRQIEWLNKSRGKIMTEYNNKTFKILKLLTKMIEDHPVLNRRNYLEKYLMKFESSVKAMFDDPDNIILSYNLHSYMAGLTGYKEFRQILETNYSGLYKKYSEYFDYSIRNTDLKEEKQSEFGLLQSAVA